MSLPEWLVRYLTYPAHERLRRRPTLHEFGQLAQLAAAGPDRVRGDAAQRLTKLLIFAAEQLPYYAYRFALCGVDPYAEDPHRELLKLPVLEKKVVRAHANGMIWRDVPGGLVPHSSGGTSGDTLHFHIDRTRQAEDLSARLLMQSLFGVGMGERRLYLWGSPIEARTARVKRWRDTLLNELLLDAFEMSPKQMDAHLARILAFRPRLIYGYPSATALLARHAADSYAPKDFRWLRLVVLTGEEVTPDQIAQVRQTFGCAVATEYGNREVGLIAHECPRGGMHVLWPHIHVDIAVRGQHVSTGQCGDVICTTLNARAQPFLRYRVGDLGRLLPRSCACGLPLPLMRLEGGKITGFIALPNGRLCHGAITAHILRDQNGIVEFKTYQHTLRDFEVLLVVDDRFDPATFAGIQRRYRALFGPQVNVDCRVVPRIPPDPSGKRRYVISAVAPNYTNFDVVGSPATGPLALTISDEQLQGGAAPVTPPSPKPAPTRKPAAPALSEHLVRRLTYPLHEKLRGRRTLHEMQQLQQIATWSPERVQTECDERLRNLFRFAVDQLPYYAERFKRFGVDPAASDPHAELAKLPVLQKADIRQHAAGMIYRDVPGGLQPAVSGGTTGDTLHFYIDRIRQAQTMGARLFMQRLFDVAPGARRVHLWGSPVELKESRLRRWRDRLLNEVMLDAFEMSTAQMDTYLERIIAFRPRLIYAYTSAIVLLAQRAARRYRPGHFPWLHVIVVTGDEVHSEHRDIIQRAFGCRVAAEYGSREVGLIAHECPAGHLHVISPHILLDITQEDRGVPAGTTGNITCTTLNTRAQPMIRYCLGDIGALVTAGCGCGLPFPVLELTGARITGFVAMPDGQLRHGHLVAYLVRVERCVVEFKVYQRALDTFEILLVVDETFTPATIPAIQSRFRRYFGQCARVKCRVVDRIPPDPSGKRRHVISDVAARYERFAITNVMEPTGRL